MRIRTTLRRGWPFALLVLAANAQEPRAVTGTATYRERIALPSDAMFEATIEDISQANGSAEVIGRIRLEKPGQPPFRFSIPYEPSQILEGRSYSVRARVTAGGNPIFVTDQSYPVFTQGKGSHVAIIMRRPSTVRLQETRWKLTHLRDTPVLEKQQFLVFRYQQRRLTGSGGCNGLEGTYKVTGRKMTFSRVRVTLASCARGMDTEMAFWAALDKVRAWKILGQHLELYDSDDNMLARFEARPPK